MQSGVSSDAALLDAGTKQASPVKDEAPHSMRRLDFEICETRYNETVSQLGLGRGWIRPTASMELLAYYAQPSTTRNQLWPLFPSSRLSYEHVLFALYAAGSW